MTTTQAGLKMPEFNPEWEYFCDKAYYDLWAVRPVIDRSFNSQYLFHVQSMGEAQALCGLLNTRKGASE